jgi:hypothetical protein
MGYVAAPDPYLSGGQGPRVHAGLESCAPLTRGPDVIRGGRAPMAEAK